MRQIIINIQEDRGLKRVTALLEIDDDGHASRRETSVFNKIYPEIAKVLEAEQGDDPRAFKLRKG